MSPLEAKTVAGLSRASVSSVEVADRSPRPRRGQNCAAWFISPFQIVGKLKQPLPGIGDVVWPYSVPFDALAAPRVRLGGNGKCPIRPRPIDRKRRIEAIGQLIPCQRVSNEFRLLQIERIARSRVHV